MPKLATGPTNRSATTYSGPTGSMSTTRTKCPGCGHDSGETIGHWEPDGDTVYVTVECDYCGDVYAEKRTYHGPVNLGDG